MDEIYFRTFYVNMLFMHSIRFITCGLNAINYYYKMYENVTKIFRANLHFLFGQQDMQQSTSDSTFLRCSFFNMGQSRHLFYLFSALSFSTNNYRFNFNNTNGKKRRWCPWDSNLWPQDGRRRQNHGSMAAAFVVVLPEQAFIFR